MMRYFKFSKLVRDFIIPNMLEQQQDPRGVRKLDNEEFVQELIEKVVEEAKEMQDVKSKDDLINELADVYEILEYIKDTLKISDKTLQELKKIKRAKNGGFDERMFIEDVGVDEDNEWFKYYMDNPQKYPEVGSK